MSEIDIRSTDDGVGVVTPRGRLTMVNARRLRQELTDLVDRGTTRVVVDLAETTFIDSSALGALVGGLKTARQAGGDLRIARPTDEVLAVFELTNMDKVLRPRDSVEGAFDA